MAVIVADEAVLVADKDGPAVIVAGQDGPVIIPVELERLHEPVGASGTGTESKNALGWKSKESFKDVCIVQREKWEPASDMIYYLFSFAGVECKRLSEKEFMKQHIQAKKGFDYVMSNGGLAVDRPNTSIYKFLMQVLYAQDPSKFKEWEAFIQNVPLALKAEVISNKENWPTANTWPQGFPCKDILLGKGLDGILGGLMPCYKEWVMKGAAKAHRECLERNKKTFGWKHVSLKDVFDQLKAKMGTKPFAGGDRPAAEDIVVFAALTCRQLDVVPSVRQLIDECQLSSWVAAMKERAPRAV